MRKGGYTEIKGSQRSVRNVRLVLSWQAIGLNEKLIPLSAYADIPLFKEDLKIDLCKGSYPPA